ncbi:MAG: tetratricopeptide repeat protein [Bacteroidota bacterium]|jgi:predicted Zn-dependent protease
MFQKTQIISLATAAAVFCVLYFGFDMRSSHKDSPEHAAEQSGTVSDALTLIVEARKSLSPDQAASLAALDQQLEGAADEASRISLRKKISAFWYENRQLLAAGYYAEEVAAAEKADSSWSVAGALYYTALVQSQDPVLKAEIAVKAVRCFENASSLAADNPAHRVNLALVYAENPPADNPMKPVLMLRELEQQYPENPSVYNALGRLAIKTGQWQRAVDRLEKAWSLDKKNPNTPCLLAKAYEGLGNTVKANEFAAVCNSR